MLFRRTLSRRLLQYKADNGRKVYSENRYCSYNVAISTAREQLDRIEDVDVMLSKAKKFADNGNFQLAEILLSRAIEKGCRDIGCLSFTDI